MIVQLEKRGKHAGARRVRERLYPMLFGPHQEALVPLVFAAKWRAGYLRECIFAATTASALAEMSFAPATRLLRAITLSVPSSQITDAIGSLRDAHFTATVRELTVSNIHVEPPTVQASVLPVFRRLRRLVLRGAYVLGEEVGAIESLVLAPTRHDLRTYVGFLTLTRFTEVTELELDVVNLSMPGDLTAALAPPVLEPVLERRFAPKLARLAIRGAPPELLRSITDALAGSPIRLEV